MKSGGYEPLYALAAFKGFLRSVANAPVVVVFKVMRFIKPMLAVALAGVGQAHAAPDPSATLHTLDQRPQISQSSVKPGVPIEYDAAQHGGPTVFVGAVNVIGVDVIDRGAFAPAIADYLGNEADASVLQSLARAVASVVRVRGYVFASAMVPQQTIEAGTVTVIVDPGAIAQIRVRGSKNARLWKMLGALVGEAVRRDVLERQLLLAGDIPGIEIVGTRYVREGAKGILIVDVRETRTSGLVGLDTYGSRDLDPLRLRLRHEWNGLVDGDDSLAVQVVATPLAPHRLGFVNVRYAKQLGSGGTQVGVTAAASRSKPIIRPGSQSYSATSRFAAVFASTPLVRGNRASVWANAELTVLNTRGGYGQTLDQRDEIATLSLSLYGTTRVGKERVSVSIGGVRGLPLAGATRPNDALASRRDGDGVFSKLIAWLDYARPLGRRISLRLAGNAQLADRPLLSSQEIGLGGPTSARAYDYFEKFGDSGGMGTAEVAWRKARPIPGVDSAQLYGFVEGGYVWNIADNFGDGALSSAGVGVRAVVGPTDLTLEAALPTSGARADTGRRSTRLNIALARRF